MKSAHDPTGTTPGQDTGRPTAPNPRPGMTRSHQGILSGLRKEFSDLVEAIVQSSAVLLADARDQEQDRFEKDLQAVNMFGLRLRDMGREYFALEGSAEPGADAQRKTLRHDMLNA